MITIVPWEKRANQAFTLGYKYESEFHGCGQCVVAATSEALGIFDDQVFISATGLCGGIGLDTNNTCSAFSGGVLVLGMVIGRRREQFDDDRENKYLNFKLVQKLQQRFEDKYCTTNCRKIHKKLFGREFDMRLKEEREAFEAAGGHGTNGCSLVVANASRWVAEIIAETFT